MITAMYSAQSSLLPSWELSLSIRVKIEIDNKRSLCPKVFRHLARGIHRHQVGTDYREQRAQSVESHLTFR